MTGQIEPDVRGLMRSDGLGDTRRERLLHGRSCSSLSAFPGVAGDVGSQARRAAHGSTPPANRQAESSTPRRSSRQRRQRCHPPRLTMQLDQQVHVQVGSRSGDQRQQSYAPGRRPPDPPVRARAHDRSPRCPYRAHATSIRAQPSCGSTPRSVRHLLAPNQAGRPRSTGWAARSRTRRAWCRTPGAARTAQPPPDLRAHRDR